MSRLTLLLIIGLPGTGKSRLARAISQNLGWPVLDKDVINTVVLASGLTQDKAGPLSYELMLELGKDLLSQGHSVILDNAGRQPFILERCQEIARALNVQLKIIRCVAPEALRVERLGQRVALPSQWAVNQASDEDQENWYRHYPKETFVVSTDESFENTFAKALTFITVIE